MVVAANNRQWLTDRSKKVTMPGEHTPPPSPHGGCCQQQTMVDRQEQEDDYAW